MHSIITTESAAYLIPDLSNDIEISNPSKDQFILINTKQGHYLKITKEINDLLSIVDGKQTIEELAAAYSDRFNISLTVSFIYQLLYNKLASYGILTGYSDNIKPSSKPNYLKLSFIVVNARLLTKFTKYFFFLFNPKIAAVVLLSITTLLIFILGINLDYYNEFNLHSSLAYLFVLELCSISFHEIGHASAANFFGAKHRGIGIGFYLLAPVFFADVTDIWRLSKRQKIVVNLAGIYFEMFFGLILILVSYMIKTPLLTASAALVCVKTLINLNPLVRSDGYWVLSDISDKPNLRTHALNKLKELYLSLFKDKALNWRFTDLMLFFYALMSYVFIGYFLYYVLFKNTGSIIYFPKNLSIFIKGVFSDHAIFSFKQYQELFIPIFFFYLLFSLFKEPVKKWLF